uniref:Uncharacterized protein n=1 Tax=Ananas comosus var. bracteatus TaxID=296719 RepID=A0A6V7PZ22_ANACO|nr:unnamed protein product [Ananas comosus var. bracteatus]
MKSWAAAHATGSTPTPPPLFDRGAVRDPRGLRAAFAKEAAALEGDGRMQAWDVARGRGRGAGDVRVRGARLGALAAAPRAPRGRRLRGGEGGDGGGVAEAGGVRCGLRLGPPAKVEIVSAERTGALALAESRNGDGGIEVGVVLPRREMDVFVAFFASQLGHL